MAGITESNNWSPDVYRFETEDVVEGGEDGLDNLPSKQLAARTNWLRLMITEVCAEEGIPVLNNQTIQFLTALDSRIGKKILENTVTHFPIGSPLPNTNIGPIWHDGFNSIMTWQVFNANGADYTGYASVLVGGFLLDTQPTPRVGYVKNGTSNLSRNTYAALRGWAMHHGIMVDNGVWVAGKIVVCDNPDGLTFKIYDVRGEGLRIWDDGRGVDTGRAFGSWQSGSPVVHDDVGGSASFDTVTLGDGSIVSWSDISDPWIGTIPLVRRINGTSTDSMLSSFINMARMRNTAFAGMVKF